MGGQHLLLASELVPWMPPAECTSGGLSQGSGVKGKGENSWASDWQHCKWQPLGNSAQQTCPCAPGKSRSWKTGVRSTSLQSNVSDPYLYHDEPLSRHGFFEAWT